MQGIEDNQTAGFSNYFGVEVVLMEMGDRRSGIDRRQFSFAIHLPERRSGRERRSVIDLNVSKNDNLLRKLA
jgi:hypothetical protein